MNRQKDFTEPDLQAIHLATLDILSITGVEFPSEASRDVFRQHGFKVDGEKVFIGRAQLEAALKNAPPAFAVRARNPEHDLRMGGEDYVLAPTPGATQIADRHGRHRPAELADYEKFAKLVQTSDINMAMSHQICYPQNIPVETAHLDMFRRDITLTDRALTGNTSSPALVRDFLRILEIVFGGRAEVERGPCSLNVINPCTPLKYAADQSESLMLLAAANQPAAVTNMMMLGATAPISVPGALALGNAEILAGVVLAQLVRPGAPVIYGSTSCPMDMKTMVAILGAPETLWLSRGALALADFYGLPCRTGGSLTDAHRPDAQALLDGALCFQNALANGASYILHSFGMMSSYLAAGFEKFVLDEEMAALVVASLTVPEVNDRTLELDLIKTMGAKGDYLTHPSTVKGFRRLFRSKFLNRAGYDHWTAKGGRDIAEEAAREVEKRLAQWEKPALDPGVEKELHAFITDRKNKAA